MVEKYVEKYADKYYKVVPCVDCGVGHRAQMVLGQPRNPRCLSCAAKVRGTGRVCKPETKAKISTSLMGHESFTKNGRKLSPEHIEKIRMRMIGKKYRLGKKSSQESRNRMRLAALARPPASEESREKRSKILKEWHKMHCHPMLGNTHTEEVRKRISEHSLQWHKTHRHPRLGYIASKGERENIAKYSRERWANPAYKAKLVEKITKANFERPTLPEQRMMDMLNEICPNEYKYTGDGSVIINGQAPDFTNVNGKKKVIEVFGDYWHSEKIRGKSKDKEMRDKMFEYAQYGFDCLIVWEHEFRDVNAVKDKVLAFINK